MNRFSRIQAGLLGMTMLLVVTIAGAVLHQTSASPSHSAGAIALFTQAPTPQTVVTPFPTVILPPMTAVPTSATPFVDERPIPTEAPWPATDPNAPFNLQIDADGFPDTRISLGESTIIVLATVKELLPARWSTPDGQRPPNPHTNNYRDLIYTPVLVKVETVIYEKGALPEGELLLFAIGGTVGQDSVSWGTDDRFRFQVGEQVLVFAKDAEREFTNSSIYFVRERYIITPTGVAFNSQRTTTLQQLLAEISEVSK